LKPVDLHKIFCLCVFSALTLSVGRQEGHPAQVSRYQKGKTNLDFTDMGLAVDKVMIKESYYYFCLLKQSGRVLVW